MPSEISAGIRGTLSQVTDLLGWIDFRTAVVGGIIVIICFISLAAWYGVFKRQ